MSEKRKALSRVAFEVWGSGELDRLDGTVAPHAVHHDPYDPHGSEGLAGLKKHIAENRAVYPDIRIAVEDQVAEGDMVVTRWTAYMTHEGSEVSLKGVTTERFEGNMIVEAWRCIDMLGFLRQIKR
jgi:predicted ester cyclase